MQYKNKPTQKNNINEHKTIRDNIIQNRASQNSTIRKPTKIIQDYRIQDKQENTWRYKTSHDITRQDNTIQGNTTQ